MTIRWAAPADHGSPISDYVVHYSSKHWESWDPIVFDDGVSTATSVTIIGLERGVPYEVSVAAVNAIGTGPASDLGNFSLSSGGHHSCAIDGDGVTRCWGDIVDRPGRPWWYPWAITDLPGAVDVSSGDQHVCALIDDGTARCWGEWFRGRLGGGNSGTQGPRDPQEVIGLTGATSLTAGGRHSCASLVDGTVRCWGDNAQGQSGRDPFVGYGFSSEPAAVGSISDVIDVSAGFDHTCALRLDGTVMCWGSNYFGQLGDGSTFDSWTPVQVQALTDVVSIDAGDFHTCAVLIDTSAVCWGRGDFGQLGDGALLDTPVPVVATTGVESISAGDSHTCAVMEDATVNCWGSNFDGQLGDGSKVAAPLPVEVVGLSGVTSVAAGGAHTCAMTAVGQIQCWGDNDDAQLGRFTPLAESPTPGPVDGGLSVHGAILPVRWNPQSAAPAVVPSAPVGLGVQSTRRDRVTVEWSAPVDDGGSVVSDYVIQYSTDGSTWTVHGDPIWTATVDTITGLTRGVPIRVRVAANNAEGYGEWTEPIVLTPATPPSAPLSVHVTASTATSASLDWDAPDDGGSAITDYLVQFWGGYMWSTFDDGVSPETSVTVTGLQSGTRYSFRIAAVSDSGTGPFQSPRPAIAAGGSHTCALLTTGATSCWGANSDGQLGLGVDVNPKSSPAVLADSAASTSIHAGGWHTCRLLEDRTLQCWGSNYSGQLGVNSNFPAISSPATVTGLTDVVGVGLGSSHSCAVRNGGEVWCWGSDVYGQLGTLYGSILKRAPVRVSGLDDAAAIAAGWNHTCVATTRGTVACWGANSDGQLGTGDTVDSPVPVEVPGLSGVVTVAAGSSHSCALRVDGSVWCWGVQPGGDPEPLLSPTQVVGVSDVEQLSAGGGRTCVVVLDGSVRCWGYGYAGQLGIGSVVDRADPQLVDLGPVSAISAGGGPHTCAVLREGSVRCWGSNSLGQVGDGSTTSRPLPVAVGSILAASPLSVGVPMGVPDAPTSVSGVSGSGQVTVSWAAPGSDGGSAITGYTVSASPQVSSVTRSCTTSSTSCVVTGLTNGVAYTFTVKATNVVGDSSASVASSAVTPSTVPGLPSGVSAVRGNGSVTIYWTAASDTGGSAITNYQAQAYNTTFGTAIAGKTCSNNIFRYCTITGLTNGVNYRFAVRATNVKGYGAFTAQTAIVSPSASVAAAPGVPTGVVITPGNREVKVAWTAPVNNGATITAYKVQAYGAAGAALASSCTVNATATTATTCTIAGLTNDVTNGFAVNATNSKGTSAYSAVTQVQPTLVKIRRGNAKVTASWTFTAPATVGGSAFSSYLVQAYNSSGVAVAGKTCTPVGAAKTCDITGLTNNTQYSIAVISRYANGTSITTAKSITVQPSSLVGASAPAAPTAVLAVAGVKQATVSWTAAVANGATVTLYTVQAYNPTTNVAVATKLCTTSVTSCTVTGLTTGTSYTFKITARNDVGTSVASTATSTVTAG